MLLIQSYTISVDVFQVIFLIKYISVQVISQYHNVFKKNKLNCRFVIVSGNLFTISYGCSDLFTIMNIYIVFILLFTKCISLPSIVFILHCRYQVYSFSAIVNCKQLTRSLVQLLRTRNARPELDSIENITKLTSNCTEPWDKLISHCYELSYGNLPLVSSSFLLSAPQNSLKINTYENSAYLSNPL